MVFGLKDCMNSVREQLQLFKENTMLSFLKEKGFELWSEFLYLQYIKIKSIFLRIRGK